MAFIEHPPPGTWRGSPFAKGRRYRVLLDAPSYEGHLRVGEILSYFGAYVGIYDGVSIYAFTNEQGQGRTWLLSNRDPLEQWSKVFAPVTEAE
jgi:hypothetical protein